MKRFVYQILFPLTTAMIWGSSFVAQSESADHIGAFTFNAARCFVGFLALLALLPLLRRLNQTPQPELTAAEKKAQRKGLIWGGFCCGTALALACNLQQLGMVAGASAGKTSFITTLYVVLVPICGLFLKKKVPLTVWLGVMVAVAGLYCLCIKEDFTIVLSDFLVLLCAFAYTLQILVIDHFAPHHDGVALSCVQFFFTAAWSAVGMLIFEMDQFSWQALGLCIGDILYVGIISGGVAYTLQILAQKDSGNPTMVSLLLSLESVFGALAGAIFLHETLSGREYLGCVLMLIAVVLAQLPAPKRKRAAAE
ncbi:MAG: DMT family transporter [Ruminococcaceae bacterium]|nr:DMT family transporter [Oscillospiraceae bacterium]